MKKWVLICSCLLSVLFTGCEDIQRLFGLLPPGKVVLSAGSSGDSSGSSMKANSFTASQMEQPDFVLTFTMEKVEISKDGNDWITILDTPTEINTEDWWTYDPLSDSWGTTAGSVVDIGNSTELDEGDYYAVRVYFGPNITAECFYVEVSSRLAESEVVRTDFNTKLYPLTIYHPSCPNLPEGWNAQDYLHFYPQIKIEEGKETALMIMVECWFIPILALTSDTEWADYKDRLDGMIIDEDGTIELGGVYFYGGGDGVFGAASWFK